MNKNEYKSYLKKKISEDDELAFSNRYKAIYVIDDLWVGGGFNEGIRSVDHWVLLDHELKSLGITWEDVLNWGIILVPETKIYISDQVNSFIEKMMQYQRLPLNNNHILGFKDNQTDLEM